MNIMPHLGRVSYGAGELKRVYIKNMAAGLLLSILCTVALLSPLWFLVEKDYFDPAPQRVIRIFKYSEIELPRPLGDIDFGLSAYPAIREDKNRFEEEAPGIPPLLSKGVLLKRGGFPKERTINDGADGLPRSGGPEKLSSDESGKNQQWSSRSALPDRRDIPGGSGVSDDPARKGGVPVPGAAGEPPSGFDRSGVGSSSKYSAEGTPYAPDDGSGGDGEGSGGFSLRWLQGMTRRKISGELPAYPAGANVTAQVKIMTVVLPDGTVKTVQPVQKANRLLEDSAMKAVRKWKFEPLSTATAQVEQSCIITFTFKVP